MARPAFKRWWTRFVPQPVERSTYVLLRQPRAAAALSGSGGRCRSRSGRSPIPIGVVVLQVVFWIGWGLVFAQHLPDQPLRAVRPAPGVVRGCSAGPCRRRCSARPSLYKRVRHPLYLGFLLAFWATPVMTAGPSAVRRRHHRLHPDRHPARGARPDRAVRRPVPPLSRAGVDADPAAVAARPRIEEISAAERRQALTSASHPREGCGFWHSGGGM